MREKELRRLFQRIVLTAAPLPIALGAPGCGGAVTDGTGQNDGTETGSGGTPVYVGRSATGGSGSGGYPIYTGLPVFTGQATGGSVGYGGYPVYYGSGGSQSTGGAGGMPPVSDAGPSLNDLCNAVSPWGCSTFCLLASQTGFDAGAFSTDAGLVNPAVCSPVCGGGAVSCSTLTYGGELYVRCQTPCLGGRRPEGLTGPSPSSQSHLSAYFVSMARLEAASIPAFRTLRRELGQHDAPKKLRQSALVAARDEVRHARATRALARRFGGHIEPPVIEARPPRSVEGLALENAVEGCVRETFGAMMATWQAAVATDPGVRDAMRRIARDETRHAALALRVAKWAEQKLDAAARRRVAEAKRAAVAQIFAELDYELPAEVASVAGVPTSDQARLMASALNEQLWS